MKILLLMILIIHVEVRCVQVWKRSFFICLNLQVDQNFENLFAVPTVFLSVYFLHRSIQISNVLTSSQKILWKILIFGNKPLKFAFEPHVCTLHHASPYLTRHCLLCLPRLHCLFPAPVSPLQLAPLHRLEDWLSWACESLTFFEPAPSAESCFFPLAWAKHIIPEPASSYQQTLLFYSEPLFSASIYWFKIR